MACIKEGGTLLADKAYDTDAIRKTAKGYKIWANIPPKSNRKGVFAFSPWVHRQRNLVERFINRIKHYRGIATRYDKNPANSSLQSNSSHSASGVTVYESTP